MENQFKLENASSEFLKWLNSDSEIEDEYDFDEAVSKKRDMLVQKYCKYDIQEEEDTYDKALEILADNTNEWRGESVDWPLDPEEFEKYCKFIGNEIDAIIDGRE